MQASHVLGELESYMKRKLADAICASRSRGNFVWQGWDYTKTKLFLSSGPTKPMKVRSGPCLARDGANLSR
jgi:hypothetical protein